MKRGRRTNEGSDYERSCESSRVESSRVVISTESSGWKGRRRQSFTIVAFQVLLASKVDRSPASNQRSRTISGKKRFAIRVLRFFAKIRTINSFLRDILFRSIETQTGAKNFVARVAVKGGRKPQPPFHLLSLSLSLSPLIQRDGKRRGGVELNISSPFTSARHSIRSSVSATQRCA